MSKQDILAAMTLVQSLYRQGWEFQLFSLNGQSWEASFTRNGHRVAGMAKDEAESIAAAFLQAVEA